MKNLIFSIFLLNSIAVSAQDYSVPALSPRQKVEQQFSISKISVDYGRPAVKGRKIFGSLVPYNQIWRAGANSSTKITFGQDVSFGGQKITAGTYGLYILPDAKNWKVILNKDAQSWGAYSYDEKLDVASVTVPVKTTPKTEYFTISFVPNSEHEVSMVMAWDTVTTSVDIKPADEAKTLKMVELLQEVKKVEREKK